MAQMKCENLTIGYENRVVAKDITFEIEEGDYLIILGENGAGKSTLIKTILGLQKPLDGKVIYSDGLKETEIGYLPQQTEIQRDFPATVREIILSGCQAKCGRRPFYSKEEKLIAEENLKRMHLEEMADKCYRELSGGQQQRVLLARALCATKKCLLLDEPVAGLDPIATADMYELIMKLNRDGITVIMISHDLNSALDYGTHVLHVKEDAFFGTKESYLESAEGQNFISRKDGEW